jgi:hypothetical protein
MNASALLTVARDNRYSRIDNCVEGARTPEIDATNPELVQRIRLPFNQRAVNQERLSLAKVAAEVLQLVAHSIS